MVSAVSRERTLPPQSLDIVGILNITEDSFSDGGRYLKWSDTLAQLEQLREDGADIIEFGAVSSNPDAKAVPEEEELQRLEPAFAYAQEHRIRFAVDSCTPRLQRIAAAYGAELINDIKGFPSQTQREELADTEAKLVVMHAMQGGDKAERASKGTEEVLTHLYDFFEQRVEELLRAGIRKERIILDPGMGFFLSSDPAPSVAVLRELPKLRAHFGCELFVSVSRKSFLRAICDVDISGSALPSALAELFAVHAGARYIRTHEPKNLRSALRLERELAG